MAKVKIVCDASYDDKLRLTGYAGGLYVSEAHETSVSYMYSGAIGELHNIQEGELFAILSGLRELELRNSVSKLAIEDVEIYTDSKSSVLTLLNNDERTISDSRTRQLFTQIQKVCNRNKWSPHVDHVNSHVEQHNASGIERLNLIADQRANATRKAVMEQLLSQHAHNSNIATLLLPGSAQSTQEEKAFSLLAKELTRRNVKMRVFIDSKDTNYQKHPFIRSLMKIHKTKNINFLGVEFLKPNDKVFTLGLNSVLYRHHNIKKGATSVDPLTYSETEKNAFSSAILLHGDLTFRKRGPTKLPILSDAVYDLMDPFPKLNDVRPDSIQGWCDSFCEHTKIPYHLGMKNVFASLNLQISNFFPRRIMQKNIKEELERNTNPIETKIKGELKDILERYGDALEPNQINEKLVDAIVENGAPRDNTFREALTRFVSITPRANLDTFINRILKQADKLTPPVQKKIPNDKLETPSSILGNTNKNRAFKF